MIARPGVSIFVIEFRSVFLLFCMISQHFSEAKQDREPQKRPHFDAFQHVTRWGAFFAIARAERRFFRAHFAVILDEFWRNFA